MKRIILTSFAVILVVTGCAKPELTRRYKSAKWKTVGVEASPVAISAFVISPPKKTATATLLSLTPRGQAALIDALSGKSASTAELLLSLGESVGKKPSPGTIVDKTRFKKRIVLSAERIGKRSAYPEDRIHQLRWIIQTQDSNVKFVSWDRFSTIYETVDLGKINLQQNENLELAITAGPGPQIPVSGSANFTTERSLSEEVLLRKRYLQLTGILQEDKAVLLQQGVVGIDLAGNAFVDIEVKVLAKGIESVLSLSSLRDANNDWKSQEDIDVIWSYLKVPQNKGDIIVNVNAEAVVREVRNEGRSVLEGDDCVNFVRGSTNTSSVVLIPITSLKVNAWFIAASDGTSLDLSPPNLGTIQFATYKEARDFMQWLREKASQQTGNVKIGNNELLLGEHPLLVEHIRDLGVKARSLN